MDNINDLTTDPIDKGDNNQEDTSGNSTKKILIVEDDKDLQDFYYKLLVYEHYSVYVADNGQQGLEMVMSLSPSLVILDLMMPVMDGKTMLHKMREIPAFKETPVIILTNAGETENILQTKYLDNASEFLIKSNIAPDVLLRSVKALV